jgi:hypothetical protein
MKKLTILLLIFALVAGGVFAQGIVDQPQGSDSQSGQQLRPAPQQRDGQRQRPDRLQRDDQRQRPDLPRREAPQQRLDRQQRPAPQVELSTVSVTGTLQLKNGFIALVSGDDVYYVPAISRLVGFIDGLKEGKQVSVEGLTSNRDQRGGKFLHLVKLTVDGKAYDFPTFAGGQQGNFGPGQQRFDRGRDNYRDRDRRHYAPPPNKGKGQKRGSCCGGWA